MLVLFIRINGERIWENWGMDNVLAPNTRLSAFILTDVQFEANPGELNHFHLRSASFVR